MKTMWGLRDKTGCRAQVAGRRLQGAGYRAQVTGRRAQVAGRRTQVAGRQISRLFCKREKIFGIRPRNNLQPATCNLQSATCNLQPATCNLQTAFTLLEVMVAVSIMAIVLVAVYSLQAQTISMANSSRFHTIAPLLAQGKIAEFEIKPSDELGSDSGDFGEDFPNYNWSVSVEDVESEFLGELAENLKRIDVSVNFNNEELVYHFRTYRFLEKEDG